MNTGGRCKAGQTSLLLLLPVIKSHQARSKPGTVLDPSHQGESITRMLLAKSRRRLDGQVSRSSQTPPAKRVA